MSAGQEAAVKAAYEQVEEIVRETADRIAHIRQEVLDEYGVEGWKYEPRAFASDAGQYLPDFYLPAVVDTYRGFEAHHAYVEVKPNLDLDRGQLVRQMKVIWESEPDAHLLVATPQTVFESYTIGVIDPSATKDEWGIAGYEVMYRRSGPLLIGSVVRSDSGPWSDGYWQVD